MSAAEIGHLIAMGPLTSSHSLLDRLDDLLDANESTWAFARVESADFPRNTQVSELTTLARTVVGATADALRTSREVCRRGAIRAWIALVHYPQANPGVVTA